jgi:hypothetical protein
MYLKENNFEVVSYMQLAQGVAQWRILVNKIKHFGIP